MSVYFRILSAVSVLTFFPGMIFAADAPKQTVAPAKSELAEGLDKLSTESFPQVKPGSFAYAILHGTPWVVARYRYENVEQDGIAKDANASTLRTKIGYKTGLWNGFQFAVEGEDIRAIGNDRYNSTTNGKTQFPVVSDPEDTDLNQLYISYQGLPKTNITVGRQLINLDNQRFVGSVDWRQNDQTFDAASISSQYIDHASLYYAYVEQVNRITGPDASNGRYESDSHLINASYEFDPALKLTVYDYLLDFNDNPTLSSQTYGARVTGKYAATPEVSLLYTAEAASQSDYGNNTADFDESYYLVEPGISWSGWTAKLGYEELGGDGTASHAFQTPLATLHAFNGWADKFLTTPANGLEDAYISLGYKVPFGDAWLKGTDVAIAYHDFDAEHTNADYGTEWNALIQQTFAERYMVGLKYADYNADTLFTDTQKVIATLQVKF